MSYTKNQSNNEKWRCTNPMGIPLVTEKQARTLPYTLCRRSTSSAVGAHHRFSTSSIATRRSRSHCEQWEHEQNGPPCIYARSPTSPQDYTTVVSRLVFQAKLLFGSRVGQTNRKLPTVGQMTNCHTFHLVEHTELVNQASIIAPANRQRATTTIGKTIASTCLSADYNPRRKTVWQRPATHRVKHDHDNPEWRFRPS